MTFGLRSGGVPKWEGILGSGAEACWTGQARGGIAPFGAEEVFQGVGGGCDFSTSFAQSGRDFQKS